MHDGRVGGDTEATPCTLSFWSLGNRRQNNNSSATSVIKVPTSTIFARYHNFSDIMNRRVWSSVVDAHVTQAKPCQIAALPAERLLKFVASVLRTFFEDDRPQGEYPPALRSHSRSRRRSLQTSSGPSMSLSCRYLVESAYSVL